MLNYKDDGITQGTMAKFASVSVSAISRYLTNKNLQPIGEGAAHRYRRYSISTARLVIKELQGENEIILNKKHAFYNFKGGTGKTSICFQVSSHLALMGYKVLVIDADPQAHLSVSLGVSREDTLTLYDIIIGNRRIEDAICNIYEGLDCIPSNLSLTRLESDLSQMPRREERLTIELKELENGYDFIFIDTNPTISILNRNIINYVDILDIVCETRPYSLNGLKLLMDDLNKFFHHMEIEPKIIHIIPNKYEDRTANSAEAMTVLKNYYSRYIKEDFAVRRSEDIVTSAKIGKPLAFFVKKNSIALEDIVELSHYIKQISK